MFRHKNSERCMISTISLLFLRRITVATVLMIVFVITISLMANPVHGMDSQVPDYVLVTEDNNGQYIVLNKGQILDVRLNVSLASGYRWEEASPDDDILQVTEAYNFKPRNIINGQGEKQIFYFIPRNIGTTYLYLIYQRPWEKAKPPIRKLSISIEVTGLTHIDTTSFTTPAHTQEQPKQVITQFTSLPTTLNWCDQGYCTPVKDQGQCGACWAFSAVGIFESAMKIWDNTERDLSEQYLVSCNMSGWGCGGGYIGNAQDYHIDTSLPGEEPGSVYETDFPYVAEQVSCGIPYPHHERLQSWGKITTTNILTIKRMIYEHGPITASVCAGPKFENYTGGIFATDESNICTTSNHAIVLVGWNDADQVWYLRNSWGSKWGESGYMRIRWDTSSVGINASYVVYGVPQNTTATMSSSSQIDISWSDITAAEQGFTIERSPDGITQWSNIATVAPNTKSYSDSNLSCNTTYYYRLQAYRDTFKSGYTPVVHTTTAGCSGAPIVPANVTITPISASSLQIAWENINNAIGFKIERSINGQSDWFEVSKLNADTKFYLDDNLTCNTGYFYRVSAYNIQGSSLYTDPVSAITLSCASCPDMYEPDDTPSTARVSIADGIPQRRSFDHIGDKDWLVFSASSLYTYTISTSDFSMPNQPYLYLYDTQGQKILSHGPTITWTATQNGMYYIRAIHPTLQGGCGAYTYNLTIRQSQQQEQSPQAPSLLTAETLDAHRIAINWQDNSSNEDGFEIDQSNDGLSWSLAWTMGSNGTRFNIYGYDCNQTVYYRVRSFNKAGVSAYSNIASTTTLRCGDTSKYLNFLPMTVR